MYLQTIQTTMQIIVDINLKIFKNTKYRQKLISSTFNIHMCHYFIYYTKYMYLLLYRCNYKYI